MSLFTTSSLDKAVKELDDTYLLNYGIYATSAKELAQFSHQDTSRFGYISFNQIESQWSALVRSRKSNDIKSDTKISSSSSDNVWEWQNDDGSTFTEYPSYFSQKIEQALVGDKIEYCTATRTFQLEKLTNVTGVQINPKTGTRRPIRKQTKNADAISKGIHVPTYFWQYQDDDGRYKKCDNAVTQELESSSVSTKIIHQALLKSYELVKSDTTSATQKNLRTGKERKLRRTVEWSVLLWEWKDNDGTYKPYTTTESQSIENATFNKAITLGNYSVVKTSKDTGIQINVKTSKQRQIRRQIFKLT